MKLTYQAGKATLYVEAATQKEIFQQLADLMAICTERRCGLCQSEAIFYEVREVDGNSFYAMRCECGGELNYGQHKNGATLFAKRTDHPESNGWYKWKKPSP